MKKFVLTAAILMGFAMSTYAQDSYTDSNPHLGGGIFQRGNVSEKYTRGDDAGIWLPGHNITDNWNSLEQGSDAPLPVVPLGGGALLLVGFGAAYAMAKRNKKD